MLDATSAGILQADATVIAGVLILFSIYSLKPWGRKIVKVNRPETEIDTEKKELAQKGNKRMQWYFYC